MRIILYNNFHIGDTFVAKSFIKRLCEYNKEHSFELFCYYNYYIYSDIPNLKIQYKSDKYIHPLQFNQYAHDALNVDYMYKIFEQNVYNTYFKFDENTIAINTWIGTWFKYASDICIECNHINYLICAERILQVVNNEYKLNLTIGEINNELRIEFINEKNRLTNILTEIPTSNFENEINKKFREWKNSQEIINKIVIFYYNFYPSSGQQVPIMLDGHNYVINTLINNNPNIILIVPNKNEYLEMINRNNQIGNIGNKIYECADFVNYEIDPSCKNVAMCEYIASLCDYSIHYDIGACFYYMNNYIDKTDRRIIHIGVNDKYVSQFIYVLNKLKINKNIHVILSNNIYEILNQLLNYIS